MWSSLKEYHRPATLNQACRYLLRQYPRTVPLAGGTWLVAHRDPTIEAVVDLSALRLAYVRCSNRRIRLGAMTSLQTLLDTPAIQELANGMLMEALNQSAPRAIRNVATLGGTLIAGTPFSEVGLVLLALDARVVIHAPTEYLIPLQTFYANLFADLPQAGILTEVVIPQPTAKLGTALASVRHTPQTQPVVNAAALVLRAGHVCRFSRLVLGGVAVHPLRLPEIEEMISYRKINAAMCDRVAAAVQQMAFLWPISEYQREMAGVVVARVLQKAWEQVAEKE